MKCICVCLGVCVCMKNICMAFAYRIFNKFDLFACDFYDIDSRNDSTLPRYSCYIGPSYKSISVN